MFSFFSLKTYLEYTSKNPSISIKYCCTAAVFAIFLNCMVAISMAQVQLRKCYAWIISCLANNKYLQDLIKLLGGD